MAGRRRFGKATQDARGNWWGEGEGERVAVSGPREDLEGGGTYYSPYDSGDIEAMARGGLQEALLGSDAFRWQPGAKISAEEFAPFFGRLADPRFTQGVEGMTADSYLNDPRAAVRRENGELVYRPDLMQGDFDAKATRKRGWRQTLKEFLTSPAIGVMMPAITGGISSLSGAGAATMGSSAFPTFMGEAAGAAGGAGAAGAASAGVNALNSFDTGAMGKIWGVNAPAATGGLGGVANIASTLKSSLGDLTTGSKVADGLIASAALGALTGAGGGASGGDLSGVQFASSEEASKAALRAQVNALFDSDAAKAQFAAEDEQLGGALRGYYTDELGRKYEDATRAVKFRAADTGNLGTPYADKLNRLDFDKQTGATRIDDAVRSALAGLRSQREGSRGNALSMIASGGGAESVNATSAALRNSLSMANSGAKQQLFGDLLSDAAVNKQVFDAKNKDNNMLAALKGRTSAFYNPVRGGSGTVINY